MQRHRPGLWTLVVGPAWALHLLRVPAVSQTGVARPSIAPMELHWVLLLSPSGASEAFLPPSSGPSPPFRWPHPAPCSPRPLPHCRGTTTVDGAGFGIDRPAELSKEDDEYEAFRKRMMLAYRFRPNPLVRVSPSPSCFCWVTTVPPLEGWWCW